jgi:Protein of unknown function (DUF2971)
VTTGRREQQDDRQVRILKGLGRRAISAAQNYNPLMRAMPDRVFHYASNAGFIAIVKSKSIWASDIRYLNDSRDYTFAFEIFDEVFHRFGSAPSARQAKFIALVVEQLEIIRGWQTFVASFSEVDDLLSQWRGYCPPGQGVSIGFHSTLLLGQSKTQDYRFVPCIYDRSKQIREVKNLISRTRPLPTRRRANNSSESTASTQLHLATEVAVALHELAARLKHPAFAGEKEWRLVSVPRLILRSGLQFRDAKSYVVPYRTFALTTNDSALQIAHVTVGPSPHPLLAQQSIVAFLRSEGCDSTKVLASTAPFRVW